MAADAPAGEASRPHRTEHRWLPALVAAVVIAGTVLAWLAMLFAEGRQQSREARLVAAEVRDAVVPQMRGHVQALERLARRWERWGATRQEVWTFDARLQLTHFPGFRAIEWVDPTLHVRWIEPLAGNEAARNLYLGFETRRRAALEEARARRAVVITRSLDLVVGGRGFLAYHPIFPGGKFQGFMVGAFRYQELLHPVLSNLAPGYSIELTEGGESLYRRGDERLPEHAEALSFPIYNASWQVQVWPTAEYGRSYRTYLAEALLVVGLLLALALGMSLRLALLARQRSLAAAAHEQAAFLAEASALLASSLDFEETIATVARLAVPRVADWVAVDVVQPDGSLRLLAVAHQDPAKVELARELRERYPPAPDAPQGAYQILRTGKAEFIPEIPKELVEAGLQDAEHERIIHALDLRSYMGVPLQAHGRTMGVMTFIASGSSGRRYSQTDLALARDLAHHAGLAMDNARLYSESMAAQEEIRWLNQDLERRVVARTAQLQAANQELEGFSYTVSHDLRAPLRAISGFSRILSDDYSARLDDEGNRLLQVIVESTNRMGELIDGLLAFARLGRKQLEVRPVDMARLARDVADELRHYDPERRVDLTIGDLPPTQADPTLIRQVLTNLLSNALKFTRDQPAPAIDVQGERHEGERRYSVRDNGSGFDMRYVDKLFGVFQRLHRTEEFEGTGIGLALVRRIVERHGGRVWAESKPGEGATFWFSLPDAP